MQLGSMLASARSAGAETAESECPRSGRTDPLDPVLCWTIVLAAASWKHDSWKHDSFAADSGRVYAYAAC